MIFLGNSVLGNLNKHATSQESLGLPFWRLVIGSGIVVFVMGFVNIVTVCQPTELPPRRLETMMLTTYRASFSGTPKPTSQPDKSDLTVLWPPTKPMSKPQHPDYPTERADIDHSSLGTSEILFPRTTPTRPPVTAR